MKQYILIDMELIDNEDKGLNSNDKLAYSLLYNRMISSVKQGGLFFDKKRKEFYVIYTLEQMANKLNIAERTAGEIYKRLEEQNMIQRKKQKYSADKIFLPLFDMEDARRNISKNVLDAPQQAQGTFNNPVHEKTSSQYPSLTRTNYVYSNYKKTVDTVNTENDQKNETEIEIKRLRTATIGKSRMHPNAVDSVLRYVNYDAVKADNLIGIIYRAKSNIAKINGLSHAKVTRFEHNDHMNVNLAARLNHIFEYLDTKDNKDGYLMTSLQTYFMKEFGLIDDEKVTPQPQQSEQGHKSADFECLNENASETTTPKIIDALMMKERLKWFSSDNHPNNSQQSEIKERIKALLTDNGIDPNSTTQLDKDSEIIKAIDAEIAKV